MLNQYKKLTVWWESVGPRVQRGFTLIELIAAMFIFSILITVFGNVFLNGLSMQRRAFNIQQIVENANFVFDSMAKEIRVARVVTADTGPGCSSPSVTLNFTHPVSGDITYTLTDTDVHRIIGGATDTVLNSNRVEFVRFVFCVSGSTGGDNTQPRITAIASVRSKGGQQQETIDLQATLSQRYLSD